MKSTVESRTSQGDPRSGANARTRGPARAGMVNMKDVAQHAGVSSSTVSRVIAQNPAVQPETRDRVLEAMRELDYVVNGLAQSMLGRGSRAVGFLVSHMVGPTFADVAQGVEEEVSKSGDLLTIITTHGDPEGEMQALQQMREQRARAVLLVGASRTGSGYGESLQSYQAFLSAAGTRLVLCGHPALSSVPNVPSVHYDNAGGTRMATEHLLALGHRRIVYLGAQADHSTAEDRLRGYRQALEAAGLEVDPGLVPDSTFELDTCQAAMEELVSAGRDFTAVVAARDEIAVRALRVFRRHGINVPQDVSLVGYDDMPFMADLTPALTTVRVPYRELGRRAGRLISNGDAAFTDDVLPVELIVRESTGPAPEVRAG
ncbi:LacI family DNA-binding transcriptional regulator [Arthrobacter sp. HS15c]|uniref:LacI family DNA-binding transcriptional regulator n=1 Tax=Arthrobacter sp. HS15c TaxID=3230279 RepID=UPI0034677A40